MKYTVLVIIILKCHTLWSFNKDYKGLPFLDQNIKFGFGMSYSKLEANSDVGNYFLLSQANPRFEMSYSTAIKENYRSKFSASLTQELFRPENNNLSVKTNEPQGSGYLAWQPMWLSEKQTWARGLKVALKNTSVISELPDPFNVRGDIANRYSAEAGLAFAWYAQTVSKFPLSLDAEILYSQTLFDHSIVTYYNGYVYRFGIDFEFKKRTLFSGWGFRAFYEFEDIRNQYSHFVDKEIGVVLNKAFLF